MPKCYGRRLDLVLNINIQIRKTQKQEPKIFNECASRGTRWSLDFSECQRSRCKRL